VRQLITRIDDSLHARLKAKAEAEGRSMNDIVTEALKGIVDHTETPDERHARLLAAGKLIAFEPESEPPGHDELEERSRGWGTAVSEALEWSRGEW
jgi:plasmid stability protein